MSARRRLRAVGALVRRAPAPAMLAASCVGWAALMWSTASEAAAHAAHSRQSALLMHAMNGMDAAAETAAAPHAFAVWPAMILAMAPLLLMREVGRLWRGSLRRTRMPTIGVFLTGYGMMWLALGIIVVPLSQVIAARAGLVWLAVAVTVVWQCSPLRQRAVNVCHRAPALRVFGSAAQWDAWRYGAITGGACAASCGPVMLLVLLAADYHLAAMVVATILLTAERYHPARRPRWRLPFTPEPSPEWLGARSSRSSRVVRGT
ncbi:DUF2182 domain-containing protein [Microbacterium deminutum]|uniref:DUF2182 domain-containing protein n=1 Tax=Microbacterium deminutum TaxID=344164 RepID=A0ABP5BYB6_9MICO